VPGFYIVGAGAKRFRESALAKIALSYNEAET